MFTSGTGNMQGGLEAPPRIAENPSVMRAPIGEIQALLAKLGLTPEQVRSATPVTVVGMCIRSLELRLQADPTDRHTEEALGHMRNALQSMQATPTAHIAGPRTALN